MPFVRRFAKRLGLGRMLGLVLLLLFLVIRTWDPLPVEAVRLRTFDFYQLIHPRETDQKPVVIIDLDEASLRAFGQWPWPRTMLADMVRKLGGLGALVVAFDVIFAEPDRLSPSTLANTLPQIDPDMRDKLRTLPSSDQIFADAMSASRVVLGQSGLQHPPETRAEAQQAETALAIMGPDPSPFLISFPGLLRNVPELERAAAGRGLLTIRPEYDGMVRRVPLLAHAQGAIVPSLALETLRALTNSPTILVRTEASGIRSVAIPGLVMPTDQTGQLWIHFRPHDPALFISAKDLLENRVGAEQVQGKLVLIGTSAIGLLDTKTTPIDPVIPGVEVHAQVLENILAGSMLSYPSHGVLTELALTALFSLAIIALAPLLGAVTLLMLGFGTAALLTAGSWSLFLQERVLIDVTFALFASFCIYLVLTFTNYFREQLSQRRIRSAFRQYLSPALVEQLAHSPEKLVLGGEERMMTIMFSDVRGFTTISETYKDDPQGLTSLINRLLTPVTNAIIERSGTVDKYIGDAVMAFWNAPLDDPHHERHAALAALDMLARIETVNTQRKREAANGKHLYVPVSMGIGLNSGRCVVGNMGSDLRFNYSVLGDAVNLASRLEGQTKHYGVHILAGAKTVAPLSEEMAVLELDRLKVKGKTEAEVIYTILGASDMAKSASFRSLATAHSDMLNDYRDRKWSAAIDRLQSFREAYHQFGLKDLWHIYLGRAQTYQHAPPASDWDGVTVADSK